MNLGDDLLVYLSSYHEGYRLMRRRMRGDTRPVLPARISESSLAVLQVTLSRLKKRGLAKNQKGLWNITERGLSYVANKLFHRKYPVEKVKGKKNMILAFDIPESRRRLRDWLRIELLGLGFTMLQKSVWFGPAPLPKDFVTSLHKGKILNCIKFFKAEEYDIV